MSDKARCTVTIHNRKGLHARASAKLASLAESFDADSVIICKDVQTPAESIMGLLMLTAGPQTEIHIESTGPDAHKAIQALEKLILDKFGEDS